MTIVILVCVWHAIVPAIYYTWGKAVADTSDIVLAVILGTAYVMAHVIFACIIGNRVGIITVFDPSLFTQISNKTKTRHLILRLCIFTTLWRYINPIMYLRQRRRYMRLPAMFACLFVC